MMRSVIACCILLLYFSPCCFSIDCNDLGYPKQYVAYKIRSNEQIVFDGRLDEKAWTDVGFTDRFMDIQGPDKPTPYLETRVKMRWDDQYLYVGAYLQEPRACANLTQNNSIVFQDNDFEIFIDPDGSNHFYKELEFNANNINWNLLLVRPYLNGGPAVCNYTVAGQCDISAPDFGVPNWDIAPNLPSAVYVDGKLNDPISGSRFWSIEVGIPISEYLLYEQKSSPPRHGTLWRVDFSRVQWHISIHRADTGWVYWKVNMPEDNWVWQPTYYDPPNIHLPETWGYLQFADGNINQTRVEKDPQWPIRDALMKVYYAQTNYNEIHNQYAPNLSTLVQAGLLPSYVADGACTSPPQIMLNSKGFEASSKKGGSLGHVGDDRLLWFD